jgi:DNA-binding NtrC family response regulator
MSSGRLALINGDLRFAEMFQAYLHQALDHVASLASFESYLKETPATDGLCVLLANSGKEAEDAFQLAQTLSLEDWPAAPVVVQTRDAAAEKDLSGLRPYVAGVFRWPEDKGRLTSYLRQRLRERDGHPEPDEPTLREEICCRLLRQTPSLLHRLDFLTLVASHDVPMLLTGETGTGKSYLARVLHECSGRKNHPFLTVPCGALPPTLAESTFFGHVRGAFTGADRAAVGKFAAAGEGTVLLDEIDTLGQKEQAALLRVIETGEFEQLGSNETQQCRARIIAASNWCLEDAVAAGKFRQDLYYRLHVLSFRLPPLRDRPEDIVPLARGIVASLARTLRKELFTIHPDVLELLASAPWPGNIRQMQNFLHQAVLLSSGPTLLPRHLPPGLRQERRERQAPPAECPPPASHPGVDLRPTGDLRDTRKTLERALIQRALEATGNNRAAAARSLGISRVTLYKKLKTLGLASAPPLRRRDNLE